MLSVSGPPSGTSLAGFCCVTENLESLAGAPTHCWLLRSAIVPDSPILLQERLFSTQLGFHLLNPRLRSLDELQC